MKKMTQTERLLDWFKTGGTITPLTAWSTLGIYRLSARIHDLRSKGYDIHTRMVVVTNKFGEQCEVARYYLPQEKEAAGSETPKAATTPTLPNARRNPTTFRGDPDWWEAQDILEESKRANGDWS